MDELVDELVVLEVFGFLSWFPSVAVVGSGVGGVGGVGVVVVVVGGGGGVAVPLVLLPPPF